MVLVFLVLIFWSYKQCLLVAWMRSVHNKAACVWSVSSPIVLGSTLEEGTFWGTLAQDKKVERGSCGHHGDKVNYSTGTENPFGGSQCVTPPQHLNAEVKITLFSMYFPLLLFACTPPPPLCAQWVIKVIKRFNTVNLSQADWRKNEVACSC